MDCSSFRESLSARMDGEAGDLPHRWVEEHLSGCLACQGWSDAAVEATRRVRMAPAVPAPDLTMAVLTRLPEMAGRAGRSRSWASTTLRLALLAVGAGQTALSLPALLGGAGTMSAPMHVAHESGAWNAALAFAFVVVAGLPRLAAGALPLLGFFTSVLTFVTVRDLLASQVGTGRAAGHLLLLAGTLLVAALAWHGRPRASVRSAAVARARWPEQRSRAPRWVLRTTEAPVPLRREHQVQT